MVCKYSYSKEIKFIVHEVKDAEGRVIYRDFDAFRIASEQVMYKSKD